VDHEELEIGEIGGKQHTDRRHGHQHHIPFPIQGRDRPQRRERDDQYRQVPDDAVERDREAEQHGPLARLHRLTPARTALDRPAEAQGMQPQIQSDEHADEREQRDRLTGA